MRVSVLKAAREKAGLSQVQLAERLGVAPSTVAGWELGTHSVRSSRLSQLARVLRIEVRTLLS
jgi:transcriptional regulator with XRE-family HTH domain